MADKRIKGGPLTLCGAANEWRKCENSAFVKDSKVCTFYRSGSDACTYSAGFESYRRSLQLDQMSEAELAEHKLNEYLESQEEITWG